MTTMTPKYTIFINEDQFRKDFEYLFDELAMPIVYLFHIENSYPLKNTLFNKYFMPLRNTPKKYQNLGF